MEQRVIKFRAWDKHKKVYLPNDVWAVITNDFNALGVMIKDWENYREGEYLYENSQVVEQFTGITDKNGKECYSGDTAIIDGNPCVVKFCNFFLCGWEFKILKGAGSYSFREVCKTFNSNGCKDFEITGTIHDK